MADDIAKLGIEVSSGQVKDATGDLNNFSKASTDAAKAADTLSSKAKGAEGGFANMAKGIAAANQAAKENGSAVASMGASINAAISKNNAVFASMRTGIAGANSVLIENASAANKAAAAHGGLSAQGQALFHTTRSLAEQFLAGQVSVASFAQQIGHLSFASTGQGGLSGAFSEVTGLLGKMVTPMRIVGAGAVGLAAAALYVGNSWQQASGEVERALVGIGARTGTTTSDIRNFASANSTATGLSITEARNAAIELTKTGNVAVAGLKGVGDAIHGYAVLTGKDATEATKAFASALSGDLVEGIKKLDEPYGSLNAKTLEYLRNLDLQAAGSLDASAKTQALQTFISGLEQANKKAADSVGYLANAYRGFKNILSNIVNYSGPDTNTAQDTLNNALARRDEGASNTSNVGRNSRGELVQFADYAAKMAELNKAVDDAQKALDSVNAKSAKAQLDALSQSSDNLSRALLPQVQQIDDLDKVLAKLKLAQAQGVGGSENSSAIQVAQYQRDLAKDTLDTTVRQAEVVNSLRAAYGGVSAQTAVTLAGLQDQLGVASALTGAERMTAEEVATRNSLIRQGVSAEEAAKIAAQQHAVAQAQINSSANETLAALSDQYAVASASTVQGQIDAQSQATYNSLLRQGVDSETAFAVASQQAANSQAKVYVQMQKAVKASQDQLDLALAAGTDQEAAVKSAIAYSNAMDAGATSAQAAAISTNVLYSETLRAAQAANQLADAEEAAQRSARSAQYSDSGGEFPGLGQFSPKDGITGANALTPLGESWLWSKTMNDNQAGLLANGGQLLLNKSLAGGGINSAISTLKGLNTTPSNGLPFNTNGVNLIPPNADFSQVFQNIDALYQLKNAQTNDNSVKKANLQEELAWLQSQPETLARDQAIVQLYNSIKDLTNATDANTAATLNPLYSQGHGALAIGYYHAATGLDVVAQGNGGTDSIPFHAMVSPNERIRIGSPANNNDSAGMSLTQIINVSGDDTPQRRRNAIQRAQGFVAAAR